CDTPTGRTSCPVDASKPRVLLGRWRATRRGSKRRTSVAMPADAASAAEREARMPVGVVLPGGGMSIAEGVALAQRAENAGASGVYVVEAWRSAFVPLAAIAAATERVTIGPYVINAYGRTPWIAGLSALDLDDLSGGRVVIGV